MAGAIRFAVAPVRFYLSTLRVFIALSGPHMSDNDIDITESTRLRPSTDTIAEEIVYAPVPCDIGQIRFLDMPPRLDRIRVLSFDERGRRLGRVTAPIPDGDTDVEIDVELFD